MGRKPKYTIEQKVKACEEYLNCVKPAMKIAHELGMINDDGTRIVRWANLYKAHGRSIFINDGHNKVYSKEFKEKVVKEYLNGEGSSYDLAIKYSITSSSIIRGWVRKYNNHIEFEDYDPHPEVYMADTLKVSKQEKIEIIKWCLEHNRDIKSTAAHFKGNYAQIYQWVKKYELNGEDGLNDRRGKRKQEDELTEVEILKRKLKQSEAEKEEFRKKYELLKKAEQVERW